MSNLVLLTADLKGESEGFVLKETISGCFVFLITPRHSLTLEQFYDKLRLSQDEQVFLNLWQNSNRIKK